MDEIQARAALSDYRKAVIDAVRAGDDGTDEKWDEATDREIDLFENLVARLRSEPPTEAGEQGYDPRHEPEALNFLHNIYDLAKHGDRAIGDFIRHHGRRIEEIVTASPPPSGESTEADTEWLRCSWCGVRYPRVNLGAPCPVEPCPGRMIPDGTPTESREGEEGS